MIGLLEKILLDITDFDELDLSIVIKTDSLSMIGITQRPAISLIPIIFKVRFVRQLKHFLISCSIKMYKREDKIVSPIINLFTNCD